MESSRDLIAFVGHELLARGPIADVARTVHRRVAAGELASIAVFDAATSAPIDLDLRGDEDAVVARAEAQLAAPAAAGVPRGRGRPRLGVIAREVTLLPRHWDWLNAQPGGASVNLRKLVEAARKQGPGNERIRSTQDRAHRFMYAVAGDLPGFEEAARALYAWDLERLAAQIEPWPTDVAAHVRTLLEGA